MGGLELQRRLAANSNPTPIVFITAHGDTDAEKEALRLGAVAFLFKPFSQESLLEAVRSAVGGEDRMQMVNAAPVPLDLSALVERIRSEYREMPGLSLSPDQARRLWGLDERTCGEVLAALVESGFLRRTPKGAFVKTA
jgi:DNA-binding response OmpR family regulator